ncbi:hypothetical protein QKC54_gp0967 [Megavirus baoshan]|uniref:Uncharacterized protein n=1 Tax=Megavirus baoshan TaxID=2496520 RepID=A0A8K1T111_9VIRU|nr:hypothetical protein QKC54_gp0967 [Megavirus baoshan]UFX99734.1 hypothetical protein Mb0105 [Megavirus baoshan]
MEELMERGYNQQLRVAIKRELGSKFRAKFASNYIVTDKDADFLINLKGNDISDEDLNAHIQNIYLAINIKRIELFY